jgi:DNA-binding transcriptional ArsR family regulator
MEGPPDDPLDLLFSALSDRTRRRLLSRLALGPASVTDLAKPFRMSLPAVSKHLKVLERAHLVSRTVHGRVHRLALVGETLEQVEAWLDPFRTYWAGTLDELRHDLRAYPPRGAPMLPAKARPQRRGGTRRRPLRTGSGRG